MPARYTGAGRGASTSAVPGRATRTRTRGGDKVTKLKAKLGPGFTGGKPDIGKPPAGGISPYRGVKPGVGVRGRPAATRPARGAMDFSKLTAQPYTNPTADTLATQKLPAPMKASMLKKKPTKKKTATTTKKKKGGY